MLLIKEIKQEAWLANLNKTDEDFALKLYKDSNAFISKTQIHFSSHNAICFKYGAAVTKKCQLDFPYPYIDQTRVIELGSIDVPQNNL